MIQGGGVVRAFTSHQCGPGSIHRPDIMWAEVVVGSQLSKKIFQLKVFYMKTLFWTEVKKCGNFKGKKLLENTLKLENSEWSVRGVRMGKSGPLERAQLANQIQGFRIPDRSDVWEKNN